MSDFRGLGEGLLRILFLPFYLRYMYVKLVMHRTYSFKDYVSDFVPRELLMVYCVFGFVGFCVGGVFLGSYLINLFK